MLKSAVHCVSRRHGLLFPLVRRISQSTDNQPITGHYDVIIVGGGGAGISLAGAIGKYHRFHAILKLFLNEFFELQPKIQCYVRNVCCYSMEHQNIKATTKTSTGIEFTPSTTTQ